MLRRLLGILRQPTAAQPQNVNHFLEALSVVAPDAGLGANGFPAPGGGCLGFVQLRINSPTSLTIHRLWTLQPGQGNGTLMLSKLCELADQHGVELKLKTLPFGRKPHPLSREQLAAWYQRHGFVTKRKWLIRTPLHFERLH